MTQAMVPHPLALTKRRQVYLLYKGSLGDTFFDPRTHVLYPFRQHLSFNRSYTPKHKWIKGRSVYHVAVEYPCCDYCGEQQSGNCSGFFSMWVVWYSHDDVRLCCGCDDNIRAMPDYYDQRYGYPQPVSFPATFYESPLHVLAWINAGSKYWLNRFLHQPMTWEDFIKKHGSDGFGTGGSSMCEIYSCSIAYDYYPRKIEYWLNEDRYHGKPTGKITHTQFIKLINEVLAEIAGGSKGKTLIKGHEQLKLEFA